MSSDSCPVYKRTSAAWRFAWSTPPDASRIAYARGRKCVRCTKRQRHTAADSRPDNFWEAVSVQIIVNVVETIFTGATLSTQPTASLSGKDVIRHHHVDTILHGRKQNPTFIACRRRTSSCPRRVASFQASGIVRATWRKPLPHGPAKAARINPFMLLASSPSSSSFPSCT